MLSNQVFRVIWTIDIYADSAEDAARQALDIHRDSSSEATIFDVTLLDSGLQPIGDTVSIDPVELMFDEGEVW